MHRSQEAFVVESVGPSLSRVRVGRLTAWAVVVVAVCAVAAADYQHEWLARWDSREAVVPLEGLVLLLLALGCEFVDATIGMGYGTTLTPLLILMGYPVAVIVPCAVLSQLAGNLSAAFCHHQVGNVDFLRDRRARSAALLIGGIGLVVSIGTVLLALRLSPGFLKVGVSVSILGVGVFLLAGSRFNMQYRLRNVAALGAVAGFNKAFSGGGYGPLVCGGQVLAGLDVRAAVGTTAVAEAIVCLATAATYLASGSSVPLGVLVPLTLGSVLSTPVSALALRRMPQALARKLMGAAVVTLGLLALLRAVSA